MATYTQGSIDFADMPNYLAWASMNAGFNPAAYVFHNAEYESTVLLISLLWPSFIIHDDCVFLDFRFQLDTYSKWVSSGSSKRNIEALMNHCHIYDLFNNVRGRSQNNIRWLARHISDMWQACASVKLQGRHIIASAVCNGDVDEWYVTLCQNHE